jgi:hypothetical protein
MQKLSAAASLALATSLVAGCSGGAFQQQSLTPASAGPAASSTAIVSPQVFDASSGHIKHVFFSRDFLREHPQIAIDRMRAAATNNLLYNGGPVEVAPKIYLVFWGFSGPTDTAHDPDGEAQYLTNFFTAIGGSKWIATDTQYYEVVKGITKHITNPKAQVAGVWYDTTTSPLPVYQDSDVAAEALRAVAHFGYSAAANYFVATPTQSAEPGFAAVWCAYHSSTKDGSKPVAYTDFPYQPDAAQNCGLNSVNTPGTLDGVSIVGGHEEAETQTDPGAGNGWLDSSGNEIGDKCAWTNLQNTKFPNGSTFPTQPLWSNKTSSCVQSY